MDRLDFPMAIQIGKTIGAVSCHGHEAETIAWDFLRVRVEVDVSKPLCRGRRVVLDDDEEVWVSFSYAKLLNFCYWCGMVCHDNKDSDIWLSSKGTLLIESQEFGAWMRASPFNLGRKTFCFVPRLEVFLAKGPVQEHSEEEPRAKPPPPPPSSTTHEEPFTMDIVQNLERTDLVETPLPSCLSSNLGPILGKK